MTSLHPETTEAMGGEAKSRTTEGKRALRIQRKVRLLTEVAFVYCLLYISHYPENKT